MESKVTPAEPTFHPKRRNESAGQRSSSPLHGIFAHQRKPTGNQSGLCPKRSPSNINGVVTGKGGDLPWRHRPQSEASTRSSDLRMQSSANAQRRGCRDSKSAPTSAWSSKPAEADLVRFEVKIADFPELAAVPLSSAHAPLVHKDPWGPNLSAERCQPPSKSASPGMTIRKTSPTLPDSPKKDHRIPASSSSQAGVTSWANVASQPPKKPFQRENAVSSQVPTEDAATQPEEGTARKKKRKKKKKTKDIGEGIEAEPEDSKLPQEPPRFKDEEEFPGLAPAQIWTPSKNTVKENQQNEANPSTKTPPTDAAKKAQVWVIILLLTCVASSFSVTRKSILLFKVYTDSSKVFPDAGHLFCPFIDTQKAEKTSGKKSKAPVQLDIGNMLSVLQSKQKSQKAKQNVISVGGGLPVSHKQATHPKKAPREQDKIAHNPLDSTSPLVKKGKQREVPKAKKPTALKKVILKEREERKQRRLLEERGLLPENESTVVQDTAEDEQGNASLIGQKEDLDSLLGGNDLLQVRTHETERGEADNQQNIQAASIATPDRPKIHSRKFREYCSQMLSKDVDQCVTSLLRELVRFQDRLYQKDPMKARMKRRLVMGLREVLKHLKLRKVKCVIISPNCERVQAKGGLDEALHTIIDTCRDQEVPFIFALSRKALGRCVKKTVPVSLVGIFNYDGAQDYYHKMIELSSEARQAYEAMLVSVERHGHEDQDSDFEEQNTAKLSEAEQSEPESEEPGYSQLWRKLLEKDGNFELLNFNTWPIFAHSDGECIDDTDEDEKS
ncbi:selenocysteine insertion sequence-binding protein 2-like isoform X4 [Dunckerocampus dactyliophorus]|uniref:selenocysteine insertion sequence-binding protein 2-like isoform X4 n=1 Tax=Dunckerocampus dactyliophorus TaxID=161453 RepID=UPI002405BAD4|nr:selenocysteine insertion sequence-binding protein 2-like isoform X4 [Dunckerocampus dactyliophorus]